jgi:hypothetical protein
MRLAFAIATSIKPEILLLDEMLSAGDLQFLDKAKRRIQALLDDSKILVLVSHDLDLVERLVQRVIVLEHGRVVYDGPTARGLAHYRSLASAPTASEPISDSGSGSDSETRGDTPSAMDNGQSPSENSRQRGRLLFDHIPKTGGTSLWSYLKSVFGEDEVSTQIQGADIEQVVSLYPQRVLSGHFLFPPGYRFPSDFVSLTVLRNPFGRILSDLTFVANDVPEAGLSPVDRELSKLGMDEIILSGRFDDRLRNPMARHLASRLVPKPGTLSDEELFTFAEQSLRDFDLVGTTEDLGFIAGQISRVFGLHQEPIKSLNVSRVHTDMESLSEEARSRLESICRVDLALWELARTVYREKTARFEQSTAQSHSEPVVMGQLATVDDGFVELLSVLMEGEPGVGMNQVVSGQLGNLKITFKTHEAIGDLTVGFSLWHESGLRIFGANSRSLGYVLGCQTGGEYQLRYGLPLALGVGTYRVSVAFDSGISTSSRRHLALRDAARFKVVGFLGTNSEGALAFCPSISFTDSSGQKLTMQEIDNFPPDFRSIGFRTPPVVDARGGLTVNSDTFVVEPGRQVSLKVTVENGSDTTWYCSGSNPVRFSYHWRDLSGEVVVFDGFRTPMPRDLKPRESITGNVAVEVPDTLGDLLLELTMVQEGLSWFEDNGFQSLRLSVRVDSSIRSPS